MVYLGDLPSVHVDMTAQGTVEDYLELFIQFGYVVLFVAAYPTASLWAWVNNVTELRVDAFKLVHIHSRPTPSRVAHIGAWEPAFRMMCSMAVVTNCALLYVMSSSSPSSAETLAPAVDGVVEVDGAEAAGGQVAAAMSDWTRAMICVSLDHLLLAVQSLLFVLIPAVPQWVHVSAAKRKAAQQKELLERRRNAASVRQ